MQSAFSEHHPKFPWPKRHDLIDQTPEFQKAFDEFCDYVEQTTRELVIDHKQIEIDHYVDIIKAKDELIRKKRNGAIFPWFLIGIMIGSFVLGAILATM